MRDRIMRTIVFFDLPNVSLKDRKSYLMFRKFLINDGFIMLQQSVYSKITLNSQQSNILIEKIRKNAPKKGIIQVMNITERQYSQIKFIIGNNNSKIIDTEERLIVL